jgi:hypothetical protein
VLFLEQGGQPQHALTEFADACFAKVVSGFNVLEEILDETDAKHRTLIISMKHILWNDEYKLKDDEHWHKALKELDVNLKDDDYTDDMYYDSADEAGIADDDHIRRDKKRLEDVEKEAAAGKEHVVQHHHHGEQYLEDMEALDKLSTWSRPSRLSLRQRCECNWKRLRERLTKLDLKRRYTEVNSWQLELPSNYA